ncbi:hypothetical protein GF312_12525 [Candidatus Poribacteria bacterium]|nr:hypothetical protein [Candidatus Poribacteria bacterium]
METPAKIGISCIIGIIMAVTLIRFLPEAKTKQELKPEEEVKEEIQEKEEVFIELVEVVEIPVIEKIPEPVVPEKIETIAAETKTQEAPVTKTEIKQSVEQEEPKMESAAVELEEALPPQSPPPKLPAEYIPEPKEVKDSAGSPYIAKEEKSIELSDEELDVFIRTQTNNKKPRAFPRIHITYKDVNMKDQLNFYKAKGYGFFAVEMKSGMINYIIGKIDMDKGIISNPNSQDGLAWNYGSVITGSRYRKIARDASDNPHAYLAVVPTYDIVDLILGSIDKGINGKIDGDYSQYKSYKAIFTTRGKDVVFTVSIPRGIGSINRDIILTVENHNRKESYECLRKS